MADFKHIDLTCRWVANSLTCCATPSSEPTAVESSVMDRKPVGSDNGATLTDIKILKEKMNSHS